MTTPYEWTDQDEWDAVLNPNTGMNDGVHNEDAYYANEEGQDDGDWGDLTDQAEYDDKETAEERRDRRYREHHPEETHQEYRNRMVYDEIPF